MPKRNFTLVGALVGKTITLDQYPFVDGVLSFEGTEEDMLSTARALRTHYQAFGPDELDEAQKAYELALAEAALSEPEETAASREMDLKQRLVARRLIAENIDPLTLYGPGPMAVQAAANVAILLMEDQDGSEVVATAEEIAAEKKAAEEAAATVAAAEKERLDKEAADAAAAGGTETGDTTSEPGETPDPATADQSDQGEQSQDNGGGEQAPVDAKIETVADALQALDPANDEQWTARGVPSIEAMVKLLGRDVSRAEVEAVAPDYTRSVAKAAKAAPAS